MARDVPARLRDAYANQSRVTVIRDDLDDADELHGLVVAVGEEWVLLEVYDDSVYFDGWDALRVRDVTAVEVDPDDFQAYAARAAAQLPSPPAIPLEVLQAVVRTGADAVRELASSAPLVGVWTEQDDAEVLYIGRGEPDGGADVTLREIDSAGRWHDDLSDFDADEITRVTIGGRYQDGLERFGDPLPG
jgi:hypothetical protein